MGAAIGILVAVLQKLGNPGNMGICVACFERDIAGALGLQRAANMKITIAKEGLKIVNISGGGCPDVPFLARQMVGKTLAEAPRPRELGHTLCGYALELAYEELGRTC